MIPDETVCDLGKVDSFKRAYRLAVEEGRPKPIESQDYWNILTDHLLTKCSDGQLLVLGDSAGMYEFPKNAAKLTSRVCTDKDIIKSAAPENGKFATIYRCQITKLAKLKAAMAAQQ